MRRSAEPRIPSQGEILFDAQAGLRARIVNLSRGGLCARGALPEHRDRALHMRLELDDGTPPFAARARVAWVAPPRVGEPETFGLCFLDLAGDERARLSALIGEENESRPVRLRLDEGPVLRAEAESLDERGGIIGAELPWLRLSAPVSAEVDGATRQGRITWVGMDVGPKGARLRLHVEFTPPTRARRDITLPYFSPAAATWPEAPAEAASPTAVLVYPRASSSTVSQRVSSLVRLGERRRMRMAILRVVAGLLAVSALALFARALRTRPETPRPTVEQHSQSAHLP